MATFRALLSCFVVVSLCLTLMLADCPVIISPTIPQLPLAWVNPHQCDPPGGVYDVEWTIPGTFTADLTGLNAATAGWDPTKWTRVKVTHGTHITNSATWVLPTKVVAGALPAKCLVFESDTPLTAGRTVCSHGITDASGPDPGTINDSCTGDVSSMWELESSANSSAGSIISVAAFDAGSGLGASHFVIRDANIHPSVSQTAASQVPIFIQSPSETVAANFAAVIGFDRVWAHGDADNSGNGNNKISEFWKWSCKNCWITNSYAAQINRVGNEGHVIGMTNLIGPSLLAHSWLSGGSETLLFGGGTPDITDLVSADVEIRRNRFTANLGWCPAPAGSATQANDNKNRIELKEGQRFVIDGNYIENSCADGQAGFLMLLNVRACSGAGSGGCTGTANLVVQDITVTNNIFRHANQAVQTSSRSGNTGNGNGESLPMQRISFENNLLYDFNDHTRFNGSGATSEIQVGGTGNVFTANAIRDNCPAGACTVTLTLTSIDSGTLIQGGFTTGDSVSVSGCTDTTFNTPTEGPAAVSTVPTSLTVKYPNQGTPNAATTCTTVTNNQNFTRWMTWNHNGGFSTVDPGSGNGQWSVTCSGSNFFQQHMTYTNGFHVQTQAAGGGSVGGIRCSGGAIGIPQEGTQTEIVAFEVATAAVNHYVFPLRTAANYTEYPAGIVGGQPGATLTFPGAISCSGAVPDATCLGLAGFMSGTAYPPANWTTFNFHDFAVCTANGQSSLGADGRCGGASIYAPGQSQQAGGGTVQNASWLTMGPDIAAIDSATGRNTYVCSTPCGPGPFPLQ